MLRFDTATYLSLLFKFILSKRSINSLWGSHVLLFSEFLNVVSILFYNFIDFIILLYTFFVISFYRYKEYMICLISFSKVAYVLPAFTCARAIGNLWSIFLGVNNLMLLAKSGGRPLPFCCLLKSKIFQQHRLFCLDFNFQEFLF